MYCMTPGSQIDGSQSSIHHLPSVLTMEVPLGSTDVQVSTSEGLDGAIHQATAPPFSTSYDHAAHCFSPRGNQYLSRVVAYLGDMFIKGANGLSLFLTLCRSYWLQRWQQKGKNSFYSASGDCCEIGCRLIENKCLVEIQAE